MLQPASRPVDDFSMTIDGVGIHLQALVLDRARESLAAAQQAGSVPQPAAQADAILELSTAAQQLLTTSTD
jgi:hypothetical protein